MRRANTTFVNLRSPLDEVDPLVEAAKPVAKRLQPFLSQARAFAADAEPTVRDLSVTIRRRGGANDLINLLHSFPPLADIATVKKQRSYAPGGHAVDVGETRGAFQRPSKPSRRSPRMASHGRTTNDFLGCSDDFSTPAALRTSGPGARHGSFAPVLHPTRGRRSIRRARRG